MSAPIRNSVKILLLNPQNELMLMSVNDPTTTASDGQYYGRFWCPIGGGVEPGESLAETALREIYEETGILAEDVELGPAVWYGEFEFFLNGIFTHMKQTFIVGRTQQMESTLSNLTPFEKSVVEKLAWFSLDQIKNCDEVVYPVVLVDYLPAILAGDYPATPITIDLVKLPDKKFAVH